MTPLLTTPEVARRYGVSARNRVRLSLKETDMGRRRGQRKGWLRIESGSWLLTYRLYDQWGKAQRETVTIGPAEGRGKLTEKQAERFAWDHYLSKVDHIATRPKSTLSLEQFWNEKYWPLAEMRLKKATRNEYRSHWATWIKPRIGGLALAIISPEKVQQVLADVRAAGRSAATVKAVRKVISAIMTRAKRFQYVAGDNPASLVDLPPREIVRKSYALTIEQARAILSFPMPESYHEMCTAALLTGMNAAELCGLKWGWVNLSREANSYEGDVIPPLHIAVRRHFYRGEYGSLKTGERKRNIPLAGPVVDLFQKMAARSRWTGPEDCVFASGTGKPISEHNVQRRYLAAAGRKFGLSHLGWHTFRHTFETWLERNGASVASRKALLGHGSLEMMDRYTHEDREAMAADAEAVAALIFGPDSGVIQ